MEKMTVSQRIAELPPLKLPYDDYEDALNEVIDHAEIRFKKMKIVLRYYSDENFAIIEHYVAEPYIFKIELTKKHYYVNIEEDQDERKIIWDAYKNPKTKPPLYLDSKKTKRPQTPMVFNPTDERLEEVSSSTTNQNWTEYWRKNKCV